MKDDLLGEDFEFDLIDEEADAEDTINDVFARDTAIPAPAPHLSGEEEPATEEPISAETVRPFDDDEIEQGLKLATELSGTSDYPPPSVRPIQHTPPTIEPGDDDLEFDSFDAPVDVFGHPIPATHAVTPRPRAPRFGQSEMPTAPPGAARGLLEQAKRSMPAPDRRDRPDFMTETRPNPAYNPDPMARATLPGASTPNGRAAPLPRSEPAKDSALDFVDGFDALLDSLPPAPKSRLEPREPPSSKPRVGPKEMQECYAVGDFSRALSIAEEILARSPDDVQARRCAQNCRDVLTQMFAARIGPLDQVISVVISPEEVQWLALDHRAGFLLSLVDGQSTVDEILDISGMTRLDALKIIFDLTERQVVRLA
ncbi:MAG TPA: hypothetical protein VMG12_13715 [Polyangiaceae bacterium]|nr:hypothetical protein [Polyangiaceae bacterium]